MDVSCWISLALRAAVPVPRPAQNPCSTFWNVMADVSRWFRRFTIAFQRTSTSPIPHKHPYPFGIRTTVCHMHYSARILSRIVVCTVATTFRQLVASDKSSRVVANIHCQGCSARIYEGPPKRFRISLRTTQTISSSSVISSSTEKGSTTTGICSHGDGTCL